MKTEGTEENFQFLANGWGALEARLGGHGLSWCSSATSRDLPEMAATLGLHRTTLFYQMKRLASLAARRRGLRMPINWFHWALLSALFAGLTAVLAKAGVKDIDSNLATAIRTVVVLVFSWTIALSKGFDSLSKATTRTWLFLLLSGLATGASWLCYFRALQLGNASKVAPVDKLSVVIAIILAALFLGEHLTWRHWLGAGLIVSGAIIIARA